MSTVLLVISIKAPAGSAEREMQKDSADKHPESNNDGTLELTEYEYQLLNDAYNATMTRTGDEELSQAEYVLYGSYEPLTVTITHLLNNKSGVNFASYAHTGLPVGVFAQGAGSELFNGYYDNTEIYDKLAMLTSVK